MPLFLDHHDNLPLPPEAQQMVQARIQSGQADEYGAKAVNIFMGTDDQVWCLTEAPSMEAALKSHNAAGVTQDEHHIVQVKSAV